MNRDELVQLVARLMAGSGSEEEEDRDIERLIASVPHPSPTDFIADAERDWTAEEIVDECLSYTPIALGGLPENPKKRR